MSVVLSLAKDQFVLNGLSILHNKKRRHRIGVTFSIGSRSSSLEATTSSAEVRIEPGAIALTLILGHRSSALSRV